jgi:hypothetical protein
MAIDHDFAGLNVKVQSLETDVRELKLGFTALAGEMRTGFTSLTEALAERSRTPWVSIASGAAVVVTVLGFIGQLAIAPIAADLAVIKHELVPRVELDKRGQLFDELLAANKELAEVRTRATRELLEAEIAARDKSLDRLFADLQALRLSTSKPPP